MRLINRRLLVAGIYLVEDSTMINRIRDSNVVSTLLIGDGEVTYPDIIVVSGTFQRHFPVSSIFLYLKHVAVCAISHIITHFLWNQITELVSSHTEVQTIISYYFFLHILRLNAQGIRQKFVEIVIIFFRCAHSACCHQLYFPIFRKFEVLTFLGHGYGAGQVARLHDYRSCAWFLRVFIFFYRNRNRIFRTCSRVWTVSIRHSASLIDRRNIFFYPAIGRRESRRLAVFDSCNDSGDNILIIPCAAYLVAYSQMVVLAGYHIVNQRIIIFHVHPHSVLGIWVCNSPIHCGPSVGIDVLDSHRISMVAQQCHRFCHVVVGKEGYFIVRLHTIIFTLHDEIGLTGGSLIERCFACLPSAISFACIIWHIDCCCIIVKILGSYGSLVCSTIQLEAFQFKRIVVVKITGCSLLILDVYLGKLAQQTDFRIFLHQV